MSRRPCPVCELLADASVDGGWLHVECDRCGAYQLAAPLATPSAAGRPLAAPWTLPFWLREQHDRTGVPTRLGPSVDLDALVATAVPPASVDARVDRLLLAVEARAPGLGQRAAPEPAITWATRAWLGTAPALAALLEHPRYAALFDVTWHGDRADLSLGLTVDGLVRLEALGREARNPIAFLAYAYRQDVRDVFVAGAARALADTGFEAWAVEGEHFEGQITDRMVAMLRRARFVVADLTHASTNVLWEAGFVTGLGRGVIYTLRQGTGAAPFDVRGYQQVRYDDADDLRARLVDRLVGLGWALTVPSGLPGDRVDGR